MKTIVMDIPPDRKIDKLYCVLSVNDEGLEGICCVGELQCVTSDPDLVIRMKDMMKENLKKYSSQTDIKLKIAKFSREACDVNL